MRDTALHAEIVASRAADEERFKYVDDLHATPKGRVMRAQRYIFSTDLISLESRVDNAVYTPYRYAT